MAHPHSYHPLGIDIPNYVPNEWSTLALVSTFAATAVVVLATAKTLATKSNPNISIADLSKVLWASLCCPIHFVLEGYYASNFTTLQGSQHILAQLWKEYSLSDSRYLTSDGFMVIMESVTAWGWGPLSLVLAYFIVTDNAFRHPLQIIISLGQLYGNILYYGICAFDFLVYGIEYSRPENYYFYGYFVFLNAFWIVIPVYLISDSVRSCANAFADVKRIKAAGVNGSAKRTT
ncbi:hypothetical protein ASPVEDRAFT_25140 [Aspergillus versicolor CBS 583.65]|uniref:EXPERA domain-containing protein n=1 Tax=Aspergillus versicolor CBS 583.65 TaxID=1036611 RepID=A0A1L9P9V1_ASPVE|nr:uncharacterized protein ASPVEDRAFT_25140 [Aspergillus versicolor CBS 583.65]OJI98243.1 hypothetical protein ASPVEDRAFT_25140 [Aspergillus versicolor CBS 583.65]